MTSSPSTRLLGVSNLVIILLAVGLGYRLVAPAKRVPVARYEAGERLASIALRDLERHQRTLLINIKSTCPHCLARGSRSTLPDPGACCHAVSAQGCVGRQLPSVLSGVRHRLFSLVRRALQHHLWIQRGSVFVLIPLRPRLGDSGAVASATLAPPDPGHRRATTGNLLLDLVR